MLLHVTFLKWLITVKTEMDRAAMSRMQGKCSSSNQIKFSVARFKKREKFFLFFR